MNQSITPGEILSEEYLKPMGISENAMARAVGVSPRIIREIVEGERSIGADVSARFAAFFGQSPEFWRGIQTECDSRRTAGNERANEKPSVARSQQIPSPFMGEG